MVPKSNTCAKFDRCIHATFYVRASSTHSGASMEGWVRVQLDINVHSLRAEYAMMQNMFFALWLLREHEIVIWISLQMQHIFCYFWNIRTDVGENSTKHHNHESCSLKDGWRRNQEDTLNTLALFIDMLGVHTNRQTASHSQKSCSWAAACRRCLCWEWSLEYYCNHMRLRHPPQCHKTVCMCTRMLCMRTYVCTPARVSFVGMLSACWHDSGLQAKNITCKATLELQKGAQSRGRTVNKQEARRDTYHRCRLWWKDFLPAKYHGESEALSRAVCWFLCLVLMATVKRSFVSEKVIG